MGRVRQIWAVEDVVGVDVPFKIEGFKVVVRLHDPSTAPLSPGGEYPSQSFPYRNKAYPICLRLFIQLALRPCSRDDCRAGNKQSCKNGDDSYDNKKFNECESLQAIEFSFGNRHNSFS